VSEIILSEDDIKKMGKIGGAREALPEHLFDSSNPHKIYTWQSRRPAILLLAPYFLDIQMFVFRGPPDEGLKGKMDIFVIK
jgi:hypothetical protein